MAESTLELTRLLAEVTEDRPPSQALVALLYDELRGIAHRLLRRERAEHTLTTTALVHEAYLRLSRSSALPEGSERVYLAAAANTMRRVLVDYARARNSKKREGARQMLELNEAIDLVDGESEQLVALDDALAAMQDAAPRLVRLVECRFFLGLSEEETATVMGTSVRTVRRDWVKAKGWLADAIRW
jgi:RNA polymerase sigma factor (TIGR02999 family)